MVKVSVIIAVYNVEQYIERCAISLFEQTLNEVEYIFVDDCSTDESISILKQVVLRYPHRADQVKIIHNQKNSKVAFTRTIGMNAATGEYVIHCDPDDYVDKDAYKTMYEVALSTDCDIVACTNYVEDGNSTRVASNSYFSSDPRQCIKHLNQCYFFPALWTHLIKRSLYADNNIFPYAEINTGEDLNVLLRIFHYARKITYIPQPFYHYVIRGDSLTHNPNVMDLWNNNIFKNLNAILQFFEATGDHEYSTMLNYLKFTKKQFLLGAKPPQLRMWYDTYSDCRKDIFKFAHLTLSRKIMYWCFAHCYGVMSLYYRIQK